MNTSETIRAWIRDRDQMHAWVAVAVGLGPDELSARMTGKVAWEPEVVADVSRVLAVSEDTFWHPPTALGRGRGSLATRSAV